MSLRKVDLAKMHLILGGGKEELFKEIISNEVNFSFREKKDLRDFILNFQLTSKEQEDIFKRINETDFLKVEQYIDKNNIRIVTIFDSEYPETLRNVFSPPSILYLTGEIKDHFRIAVVGPRSPSVYAKEVTRKIVRVLSENNISIVSGMASGIDRIAHEESCLASAGSIGVLGAGIDVVYPKDNFQLYNQMKKSPQNVLISEFPLGFPPAKYTFPKRNRIISGLAQGVLITEGSKKSGSMITARHAYEQGKSVYALPGLVSNPLTQGVHQLIKDGATLIESAEDILIDLYPMLKIQAENKKFLNLTDIELSIVRKLEVNPRTIEEIISFSELGINETLRLVSVLEIKGIIKKEINNKYFVII
ncbi:MAG: DNA-processing protein DprA [Eubacteriales bacterium]|nr:DNA-processing protein DprA [Eubacteriales bacterium]